MAQHRPGERNETFDHRFVISVPRRFSLTGGSFAKDRLRHQDGARAELRQEVSEKATHSMTQLFRDLFGRLTRVPLKGLVIISACIGAMGAVYATAAGQFSSTLSAQKIVDRQEGEDPFSGFRRAHAKGICVAGVFKSNGQLAPFSQASIFEKAETELVGRFSIGGRNPTAPDLAAGVRSLALDFRMDNGERWRTAMNINPVLAVRDPTSFYEQLAATAPDPETGKPSPDRIEAFFADHPESADFREWQSRFTPSSSFATETYHSVNAFLLKGEAGRETGVRWSLVPVAPIAVATLEGQDALQKELFERLDEGPVQFRFLFHVAEAEDDLNDPSQAWPTERQQIEAGIVEIVSAEPQAQGACNGINFDPLILPAGIEPTADPILHARSSAYAVSLRRRALETLLEQTK